jgi:hypothetical protein
MVYTTNAIDSLHRGALAKLIHICRFTEVAARWGHRIALMSAVKKVAAREQPLRQAAPRR